ncbi:hypothetical protein A4A49_61147, partial [Nicotiana attenuata]
FCDYCKRPGHTKEKCYKLHGYPQGLNSNPNPKFNRGKRTVANVHGALEDNSGKQEEVESLEGKCNSSVNLTKEQYGQLVSLLQHFHSGNNKETSSISNGAVNFAGTMACSASVLSIDYSLLSCKCFTSSSDIWILDPGASNHMTFNKSLLSDTIILPYPLLINLPNGYRVKVTEIGTVTLAPEIILHKVFYVPSFKYNLISIHCLTSQLKSLV